MSSSQNGNGTAATAGRSGRGGRKSPAVPPTSLPSATTTTTSAVTSIIPAAASSSASPAAFPSPSGQAPPPLTTSSSAPLPTASPSASASKTRSYSPLANDAAQSSSQPHHNGPLSQPAAPAPPLPPLPVIPGSALWQFKLGMAIGEACDVLQSIDAKAQFMYGDQEPLARDLILNVPGLGICLRFDPRFQLLKLIEVFDFENAVFTYNGLELSSTRTLPTFLLIYKSFGPTYPGVLANDRYTLEYPGISFIFPVPSGQKDMQSADLLLTLPDGSTPLCERLYVTPKAIQESTEGKASFAKANQARPEDYLVGPAPFVEIHLESGILFPSNHDILRFGTPTQEVQAVLGPPSQIWLKEDDKMSIHRSVSASGGSGIHPGGGTVGEQSKDSVSIVRDYIWNYFHLGCDVVFDGELHCVKKFVLHTNFPGHYDFNRCRSVDCNMMWESISKALGPPSGPPVIFNKAAGSNPFGATSFYGYENIIFEVGSTWVQEICAHC
ncbi:hypothetical protein DFJ73DRAFT_759498 [Zopfochytrium polystomum]|nr:hypothetical protein DFJ73DRAFT_759498 [Zopfochytrium polystomum]